ncbi:MAG: sensor domain-containing diguanylate cyclase [Desulfovibrio sp.]|nr:sensor domain-containing diguanylate cyclase [Desulfovibrio sp.]
MSKIWEFFENSTDLVYAVDTASLELVYMNKKLLRLLKQPSNEAIVGKKCYEVLQGNTEPCSFCNNAALREGYFTEWRYYNPLLKRHFLIRDTLVHEEGRAYRLEQAMDLDALHTKGHDIASHNNHALLVNEGIRLALDASSPDGSIDIILEYLGKALQAERAYIFEWDEHKHDSNTYEWVALGVSPQKNNLQNLPPEVCKQWYKAFKKHEYVLITDLELVRESDPAVYAVLRPQNIHSLVVVPLYDEGQTIGFYGLDNPPAALLEDARDALQLMGYFLVTSIRRRKMRRRLWQLSHHDQLTGLQNRHAMSLQLEQLQTANGVGVAYGDVSGLKELNDTQGHEAGDALLTRTAHCLKEVFDLQSLYRIGGDEFLILCPNVDEADFENELALLRASLNEHDVAMSLGHAWTAQVTDSGKAILHLAEERMYTDKRAYYLKSGRNRRKS